MSKELTEQTRKMYLYNMRPSLSGALNMPLKGHRYDEDLQIGESFGERMFRTLVKFRGLILSHISSTLLKILLN